MVGTLAGGQSQVQHCTGLSCDFCLTSPPTATGDTLIKFADDVLVGAAASGLESELSHRGTCTKGEQRTNRRTILSD